VLKEAVSDLNRMRQILQVVVKHGFGDLLQRARIFERLGLGRPEAVSDAGLTAPQRVHRMLAELGPTFVKLGQILSTRPDLVPAEFVSELKQLQDNAPPVPYALVAKVIQEDLGKPPQELFGSVEESPLASASIAQVHRAKTQDGQDVVIKVKRPGIDRIVRADLDILYTLAHLLEAVFEETSLYDPVGMVREFDRAIGRELNLLREGEHLRGFYKSFQNRSTMVIPEPIDALCGPQVLTMKCLHGCRGAEIAPGSEQAKQAALNLIEGTYQQIFEDGLFHSDPHPGNLCFLPDGRVGLMDFGQVGRLTPAMRNSLVLMGLGIVLKDPDTLSRLVYRIGSSQRRVDLAEMRTDIQKMLEGTLEKKLGEIDTGQVLSRLLDLSQRYRVAIPAEYVLVIKALSTVESTVLQLYPDMQPGAILAPYVKRLLADRYNLDDLKGGLARSLLQLSSFLSEVPQQASQILLDLEGGRLTVTVRDPEAKDLRRTVRGLGIEIFWGLIAAGLLAGSLPAFMADRPAPLLAVLGVAGATLIAITGTLRYFLTPILRKLKLKPWLERRWDDGAKDRKKAGHED
jgi:ubiquinone biosynthesis protein